MNTLQIRTLALIFCLFIPICASAQEEQYRNSISLQSMIWLDSLFPRRLVAIAGQYEYAFTAAHAAVARFMWFRGPEIQLSDRGVGGIGMSLEYRYYFSRSSTGWHIGPFGEWNRYIPIGSNRLSTEDHFKDIFNFGIIAGHKWITDRLVFDVSLRSAFYLDSPLVEGLYPRLDSSFNSHLLISAGIAI